MTESINKKTSIALGLVILLITGTSIAYASFTTLQNDQEHLEMQVEDIEEDVVPRTEIELRLGGIEDKVDDLKDGQDRLLDHLKVSTL